MAKKGLSILLSFLFACSSFLAFGTTSFAYSEINNLTFAELSEEQLEAVRNGGKVSAVYTSELPKQIKSNKSANLPEEFKLSSEGLETKVGDQGKLSTCWAFAALTSSETDLMKSGTNVDLSEAHLSWFAYSTDDQKKAFRYVFSDYDPFMNGGFDFTAANALANWYGPALEEKFPYSNSKLSENYRYDSAAHLQTMISLPEYEYEDEAEQTFARKTLVNQVKSEMYKHKQAVDISYLSALRGICFNEETNAWFNPAGTYVDHAVTIIGWDDNFPKENFNNSEYIEEDGAWLVQNSWGTAWGDEGCFWLSYEDVTIDYAGIYLYESNQNYENIYSHDESIQYTPIGFDDSTEIYMANVFESSKKEVLEAVSFYTTDVQTQYTVQIYTHLTDSADPTSGSLMAEISGVKNLPGYYTEKLPMGIQLEKGDSFSVVVYLENPTQVLTAQVEAIYMDYRIQSSANVSKAGESFVSSDGTSWEDIHQKVIKGFDGNAYMRLGNFTIKAFTSSDKYVKFSLESGEISFSEKLKLSCLSADEIYYTTDGGDPRENGILYTGEISLADGMTVKAAAKRGGVFGEVYQREYYQATTALNELIFSAGNTVIEADVTSENLGNIVVDNASTSIDVTASSYGAITVNGISVESGGTVTVPLEEYKKNTITVVATSDGYKSNLYTAEIFVNPIKYDFEKETMQFDESKVSVKTKYYQALQSGQSVTAWLDSSSAMTFVVDIDNTNVLIPLPERLSLPVPETDYINERSTKMYGTRVYYKFSEEEDFCEENLVEYDYIPAFPGETMYLYREAQDGKFASHVVKWVLPSRPEIEEVSVSSVKKTKVKFDYFESLTYCGENIGFSSNGVFKKLTPGENYTFTVYLPATEDAFASEKTVFEITTDTDNWFENLKANISAAETDDSFGVALKAAFSRIIYNIRLFFTGLFE